MDLCNRVGKKRTYREYTEDTEVTQKFTQKFIC